MTLIPVNTTVTVDIKGHRDEVGRVVGHVVRDAEPLNVVHIAHDNGVEALELPNELLKEVPYDPAIWQKHCWTPPEGAAAQSKAEASAGPASRPGG